MFASIKDIRRHIRKPTTKDPSEVHTVIRGSLHGFEYAELPLAFNQSSAMVAISEVMASARELAAPAIDEAQDNARAESRHAGRGKAAKARAGSVVSTVTRVDVGKTRVTFRAGDAVLETFEGALRLVTSPDWQEVRWTLTVHGRVDTDDLPMIELELDVERIDPQMELGLEVVR